MSAPSSPGRCRWFWLVAVALAMAVPAMVEAQTWGPNSGGYSAMGYGGMGPGMMGGMMNNAPVTTGWGGPVLTYSQASTFIRYSDTHGAADKKGNAVSFDGADVTIDVVAVQPGFEDQTFEVHGLADPTLVVPRGATVHLNLLNMDYGNNMEHTLLVTSFPAALPVYDYDVFGAARGAADTGAAMAERR